VNTNATQNGLQENLHWALEQDQQQFLLYLDSFLNDAESRIDAMPNLAPASPLCDRNEYDGHPQTPSDNAGADGVLSVGIAVEDEGPLLSNVEYNSSAISAFQSEVHLTHSKYADLPALPSTLGTSLLYFPAHKEKAANASDAISSFQTAVGPTPNVQGA